MKMIRLRFKNYFYAAVLLISKLPVKFRAFFQRTFVSDHKGRIDLS